MYVLRKQKTCFENKCRGYCAQKYEYDKSTFFGRKSFFIVLLDSFIHFNILNYNWEIGCIVVL